MILADVSVWVDHLRVGNKALSDLLARGRILAHPFLTCELVLGNLQQRDLVLRAL